LGSFGTKKIERTTTTEKREEKRSLGLSKNQEKELECAGSGEKKGREGGGGPTKKKPRGNYARAIHRWNRVSESGPRSERCRLDVKKWSRERGGGVHHKKN